MEVEEHDFGLLTRRRVRFPVGRSSCGCGSLTPRPSLALVKFWQGRVELTLRLSCFILSSCTLASSLFSLMALKFPLTDEELIDSTRSDSHKVVVWVVCTASIAMSIQLLVVCGRFLHFKFATSHSSLIQVLDVICSVTLTSAYFTLVIPLVIFCEDVTHVEELLPKFDSVVHYGLLRTRFYISINFCSTCVVAFLALSVWMSIYLSFNWDRELQRQARPSQQQQQQQQQQSQPPLEDQIQTQGEEILEQPTPQDV